MHCRLAFAGFRRSWILNPVFLSSSYLATRHFICHCGALWHHMYAYVSQENDFNLILDSAFSSSCIAHRV